MQLMPRVGSIGPEMPDTERVGEPRGRSRTGDGRSAGSRTGRYLRSRCCMPGSGTTGGRSFERGRHLPGTPAVRTAHVLICLRPVVRHIARSEYKTMESANGSTDDSHGSSGRGSMRDRVVEQLRGAITRGDLQPGERLTEWNVANELDVSRGPVREGLLELEREGLVRMYRNRGAVVMGMTDDELLNLLLPIRFTIEKFAVTSALPHISTETIEELETILSDMEMAVGAEDTDRVTEADVAFHRCIIEAAGHVHAMQLWNSIHHRIQAQLHRIARGRERSFQQIPHEHRILLDALRGGDVEQVSAALERHIMDDARAFLPNAR